MESKFKTIDGMKIHFQVRGSGPDALLLIHGAVGSTNDFALQVDERLGLNPEEFTIVLLDLPGFGKSELDEELKNDPTREYFEMAARVGAKLMSELKHKTYAVGGWSDGARVASLLAINCQSRVNALLLWAFLPTMDEQSSQAIARTRDTSIWDPSALSNYSSVYGEQEFSDMWRKYVDFVVASLELPEQFDIRNELRHIKCPTLILHGSADPIVNYEQHVKPLEMQIYDSGIMQFEGLAHNLHQADAQRFNQVLSNFMTSVRA